nr:Holliday junction recognition protein isoform X1 [Manis javanica]
MEGEGLGDDALLRKLRNSRRSFQRRMQQLMEKYNQPFEDAPLVHMSTLTYETPQGLRIWGGGLVKERNKRQIQDFPVKTVSRKDSPEQAPARGPKQLRTRVLGVDSSHTDVDATLYQEDLVAGALMPAVPRSPLKNELRRKYLTQVDILLQDDSCLECTDFRDGKDTPVTLPPALASPAHPAQGHCAGVSGKSPGSPVKPASSVREFIPSHPCSTDLAVVPRSDSLSLQGASGDSFSSSQSFEADICNVTISDLYAGMLHSMSRLLSVKPSCIISTKTFIVQNWHSRRRHRCKSRMNKTYCRGGRQPRRSSQDGLSLCSEPVKEVEALRDCKNLPDAFGHNTGLKLRKAFPEADKPQIHKLDTSWKELKEAPQTLTYVDSRAVHHPDQENRYLTLKWLISPVKIVSRPRILSDRGGTHYREIELRFDKLHQEYCLSPRKQPALAYRPYSLAMDVYRGGPASPGVPRGFETYRPSRPSIRAKAKRLNEALENLDPRAPEVGGHLPKRGSSPLSSETGPAQGLGRSERIADLFQGNSLGIFRKSLSPRKAISVPRAQSPGIRRDRYGEIKEKFDKLHQKYCQKSPVQMKVPLGTGASLDKASVVQYQKEDFLGKFHLHSGIRKLSSSPQQSTKSPLGLTPVEVHPSPCFALTVSQGHQSPAKRCRLSDPPMYGQRANSPDSSCVPGRALSRPGEEPGLQHNWEEKREEQPIFQNGREK